MEQYEQALINAVLGVLDYQLEPKDAEHILELLEQKGNLEELKQKGLPGELTRRAGLEKWLKELAQADDSPIELYKEGDLLRFGPREQDAQKSASNRPETELYPILVRFLERKGIRAVELCAAQAKRGPRGANRWRFPDVVGVSGLDSSLDPTLASLAQRTGWTPQCDVIAYEVKKTLKISNVREAFYECMSNSAWANKRYLVATVIDNAAADEFEKLHSQHHDIGLMRLALTKDGTEFDADNSRIMFECPRRDLNVEALAELCEIWEPLDEFFKDIVPR